jgi:hypothetical protein
MTAVYEGAGGRILELTPAMSPEPEPSPNDRHPSDNTRTRAPGTEGTDGSPAASGADFVRCGTPVTFWPGVDDAVGQKPRPHAPGSG